MYNKLFTKILDSSIWLEDTPTRIVWLTFIAAMDEKGFAAFAAVGNVANRARVTLDEAKAAIDILEGPDLESGDPENEGRRIQRVPGGWMVLNAEKHRDMVTRAIIQEQTRDRVRRFRERLKRNSNAPVTTSEAEAEAETEARSEAEVVVLQTTKKATKPVGSSSKRPIFSGQRLTVFEWMLDRMAQTLGSHMDAFDIHGWLDDLDRKAITDGAVLPRNGQWDWIQAELLSEVHRRGLPLARNDELPHVSKQTKRLAAASEGFLRANK